MNRETKIFLLTHLYPVYTVMHLEWGDRSPVSAAIFNIMPIFFVSMLLCSWVRSRNVRLNPNEVVSIYLFVYFFTLVHIYYAICALVIANVSGRIWIINHNSYFVYFIIFMVIFYFINRARKQWG